MGEFGVGYSFIYNGENRSAPKFAHVFHQRQQGDNGICCFCPGPEEDNGVFSFFQRRQDDNNNTIKSARDLPGHQFGPLGQQSAIQTLSSCAWRARLSQRFQSTQCSFFHRFSQIYFDSKTYMDVQLLTFLNDFLAGVLCDFGDTGFVGSPSSSADDVEQVAWARLYRSIRRAPGVFGNSWTFIIFFI